MKTLTTEERAALQKLDDSVKLSIIKEVTELLFGTDKKLKSIE
ncbi:TPA: hypothetical protein ACGO97_001910 [Streptococcus suis]